MDANEPVEFEDSTDDDNDDEFDEAMSNCGGFWNGGVFVCMKVGSEECDWECPFSCDIGKTQKQLEREVFNG